MTPPWTMSRSRLAWWLLGGVLGAMVLFVVWRFVGTFVFGVFIYYATRPVYRRIEDYVRPPSLAAGIAVFTLGVPVILLLSYTIAVGLQEADALLDRLGTEGPVADMLAPYIDVSQVVQNPEQILESESVRALLQTTATQAIEYAGFLGNGAIHVFVMIAIGFYLLRDDDRLAAWFFRRFDDADGIVRAYATAVDRDFSNIFFGNILNAFLTGIIGAVAYNLLDAAAPGTLSLPYATLIGLLAGAGSLIPVVGMKLVYVPVAVYLFYDAYSVAPTLLWFPAVFVVVSLVIVDTIPDFVLRPYVSGRGLHVGMVMFAYILGPLLFGWPGIFLGPVLLVLLIHFVKLVLPELLAGVPVEPEPVGPELDAAGQPDRETSATHPDDPSEGGPPGAGETTPEADADLPEDSDPE
ncbi:MAG: AI-2E family transporter [Halobacteriaceae archaeon]